MFILKGGETSYQVNNIDRQTTVFPLLPKLTTRGGNCMLADELLSQYIDSVRYCQLVGRTLAVSFSSSMMESTLQYFQRCRVNTQLHFLKLQQQSFSTFLKLEANSPSVTPYESSKSYEEITEKYIFPTFIQLENKIKHKKRVAYGFYVSKEASASTSR